MKVETVEVEPETKDLVWLLTNDSVVLSSCVLFTICLIICVYLLCKSRTLDNRSVSKED